MVEIDWFWMVPTALSIGLGLKSTAEQAKGYKSQAAAQELEAKVAELGIKQTGARRMEALKADLGAIAARRATMNIDMSSGSAMAAEAGYEKEFLRTLRADILNQRYGVVSKRTSARGLNIAARSTMLSGYASAISTGLNAYGQFAGGAPGGG